IWVQSQHGFLLCVWLWFQFWLWLLLPHHPEEDSGIKSEDICHLLSDQAVIPSEPSSFAPTPSSMSSVHSPRHPIGS
ncbi:hypothetical protein STEG23_003649, partial [Scotinomys teguina]